jgi:hypothetical protein
MERYPTEEDDIVIAGPKFPETNFRHPGLFFLTEQEAWDSAEKYIRIQGERYQGILTLVQAVKEEGEFKKWLENQMERSRLALKICDQRRAKKK